MRNSKTRKALKLAGILAGVVLLALAIMVSSAKAALTAEERCELLLGGIWAGSTPDEIGGFCLDVQNATVDTECGVGWYGDWERFAGGWGLDHPDDCHQYPTGHVFPVSAPNYGMRRKGLCKLMDIEDAFLGGTITATVKGNPSVLKLKADGKTYSLPVVPGSVVANGDGTYTAQFYTMDSVTGQALIPAGDYSARCHGWGGSNDGSSNTVSIGY